MSVWAVPETIVGFLLLFFLPGLGLTLAVFPEWTARGPGTVRRTLETVVLAFVLSIVLTVLVGYVLLSAAPSGFQAAWSDPVLEVILAGITLVTLVLALLRGAFRRGLSVRPLPASEEGAWELSRELDRLAREERSLRRDLASGRLAPADSDRLERQLRDVVDRSSELRRAREAEYAE